MKLDQLDVVTKNNLATQFLQEGMAVIADIDLPDSFSPQLTDLVFLKVGDRCEVYMAVGVQYEGQARPWQEASRRRVSPGNTRKVLETRGDLFSGIGKLKTLLDQAGGAYDAGRAAAPAQPPAEGARAAAATSAAAPQPLPVPVPEPAALRTDDVDTPLPEQDPTGNTPAPAARPAARGRAPNLRNLVEDCRSNPRHFAGRESVLRALKTNLIRETKPGVVMIGKEGVGKTAVVEMLATEIAFNREIPAPLANTPIYDLPLGSLVENGRYIGDIERQARRLLDVPGRPIFFADEIHQLARQELRALCDVLKPALAAGHIRMIGATTPVEWRKVEDAAFKRRFLEMTLEEPTPWEAFIMLRERVRTLAAHHQLDIEERTIREAIMLSARYLPMRQFPDKAIDILDLASALQTTHPATEASPEEPKTEANGEPEGK